MKLALAVALLFSNAPADDLEWVDEEADTLLGEEPYLLLHSSPALLHRRHRGDWETSGATAFTFSSYWPAPLTKMVSAAAAEGDVYVLVGADESLEEAARWRRAAGLDRARVRLLSIPVESPWIRDYGPIQVHARRSETVWIDADYSSERSGDDDAPSVLGELLGIRVERLPFVLDGGALVSNGQGLCVMTSDSFSMSGLPIEDPDTYEAVLARLGCPVLALVPALSEEPTKHIDMSVQFLAPDVAVVGKVHPRESEEDAARLERVVLALEAAALELGQTLRIVRVPTPIVGAGLYRTYVNGLRLRKAFLVPRYRDVPSRLERETLRILRRALPGVRLVSIPADDMIDLDGAIHCVSVGIDSLAGEWTWSGKPVETR